MVFGTRPLLDGLCITVICIVLPMFCLLIWKDPGVVKEARRYGNISPFQSNHGVLLNTYGNTLNSHLGLDFRVQKGSEKALNFLPKDETPNLCNKVIVSGESEDSGSDSSYMTIKDTATGAIPQEGFCGFCEVVSPIFYLAHSYIACLMK